jgi:hypothetical protein
MAKLPHPRSFPRKREPRGRGTNCPRKGARFPGHNALEYRRPLAIDEQTWRRCYVIFEASACDSFAPGWE